MDEETKWPSTRVAQGGIFHLPKVKYSKETHDFLNCKLIETELISFVFTKQLHSSFDLNKNKSNGNAVSMHVFHAIQC